jgi:hypothetical protein
MPFTLHYKVCFGKWNFIQIIGPLAQRLSAESRTLFLICGALPKRRYDGLAP